jgi:Kelch motif
MATLRSLAWTMAIVSMLTASACTVSSLPSLDQDPFEVIGSDLVLLDANGRPLSQIDSRYDWERTASIVYKNQHLGPTPYKRTQQVYDVLKPLLLKEHSICLPIHGRSRLFSGWRAVQLQDKVFIIGGYPSNDRADAVNFTWFFDPLSHHVTAGPDMWVGRLQHCVTLLSDGRVLVSGGLDHVGSSSPLGSFEIYDPRMNSFSKPSPMCRPRVEHGAAQIDGKHVLVVGGITTQNLADNLADNSENLTSESEVIDVNTRQSRIVGRLHALRREPDVMFSSPGRAIVFGGWITDWSGRVERVWANELFVGQRK